MNSSINKYALCVAVKNENHYLKEYIEYYLNIGFNHIFIIDNNDDENIYDVIDEYVKSNDVTVIDWKGKCGFQIFAYDNVYFNYLQDYDWVAFFDCDEFLVFKDGSKTINDFISQSKFKEFNCIVFNWVNYSDNGLYKIENNNYNVFERFTTPVETHTCEDYQAKSIIKCNLPIDSVGGAHVSINNDGIVKRCNSAGAKIQTEGWCPWKQLPISIKYAQLNHYRTKTLEEYILRRKKPYETDNCRNRVHNPNFYFLYNEKTEEKLEWLKNNYLDVYNELDDNYDLTTYYECDGIDKENVYKEYNVEK